MAKAHKQESDNGRVDILYHCLGCKHLHSVCVKGDAAYTGPVWGWNGSLDSPTFTPSVLFWLDHRKDEDLEEYEYVEKSRCHTFITDGVVQFLNDCAHELAGKTIELPSYD